MTPFYTDDWLTVYGGDCREVLASLPADSVDCVVTSPPYWGLRDYGNDGQLGLERTPEEYVAHLAQVFQEVRRVLKPSGTCWLNLGDSYAASQSGGDKVFGNPAFNENRPSRAATKTPARSLGGLKPKDLVGIPWRVAFALQADGWYLRSDIIWSKPNPMPESVTDRPTKSHEYLFLLTKSPRYFFDADAVREEGSGRNWATAGGNIMGAGVHKHIDKFVDRGEGRNREDAFGRNIRSVWNIATRPYPGAHFAVFPPELPERCIKAGSSEHGVCSTCGAPYERIIERIGGPPPGDHRQREGFDDTSKQAHASGTVDGSALSKVYREFGYAENRTVGWRPTCAHDSEPPVPAVVLDPFGGSGTVGMVANRLSRRAILIDLNPEYLKQQMKRNAQTPLGLPA
jgi:DNA modification methylase